MLSTSAFANHNLDFSLSDYCDESPAAKAQIKNGIYYHPKQAKPYSGESICFYKTGQLYAKSEYKNGLLNGKKTMHWENGRQSFEGNFIDDQINGKETWWYESGQIKSEKYYKDSKLDGKYTEWYENGQKSVEANFIYFKLDGKVTYYRKNGTTKKLEHYENGVLIDKNFKEDKGDDSALVDYQWTRTDNSFIGIKLVENVCFVSLSSINDGFSVDVQLTCDANGQNCYKISSLSCQGKLKTPATPTGCPGGWYCPSLASCSTSMPGALWDIPSLLETEGCNTYNKGKVDKAKVDKDGKLDDTIEKLEYYENDEQVDDETSRLISAAENGGAKAQFELAWQYYDGQGVKQSNFKAAHWWLKAAQQGHPKAQTELANLIYLRDGDYANTPSVDLEEALFWLNKAAKQGHWDAKGILNELYERGFIKKNGDSFIVSSN